MYPLNSVKKSFLIWCKFQRCSFPAQFYVDSKGSRHESKKLMSLSLFLKIQANIPRTVIKTVIGNNLPRAKTFQPSKVLEGKKKCIDPFVRPNWLKHTHTDTQHTHTNIHHTHIDKATSFEYIVQVKFKEKSFIIQILRKVTHHVSSSNTKILGLDIQ